jgi:3-methylcrotonyl-CoA carboxylase alpha subunit
VFAPPAGEGIRVDTGVREGDQVSVHYDPMIAKLLAHGATRGEAAERMSAALARFRVEGIVTNIAFLKRLVDHPAFRAGDTHTGFIEAHGPALVAA